MPKHGRDERTLQMMEHYVELWKNGMTPREIAKHYGLSYTQVYNCLGEIAEKAGYQRSQLLQQPHSEHHMSGVRIIKGEVEKVDAKRFEEQLEIVGKEINSLQGLIKGEIKQGEEFEAYIMEV